jgi:hypothetical protein
LAALAAEKNRPKILAAPLTVIIGNDLDFPDTFPKLLAHNAEAAQKAFAEPGLAEVTAMRNGSLQGAYLIVAARALGLDCGPMSGFDNAGVDQAFFAGTERVQSELFQEWWRCECELIDREMAQIAGVPLCLSEDERQVRKFQFAWLIERRIAVARKFLSSCGVYETCPTIRIAVPWARADRI